MSVSLLVALAAHPAPPPPWYGGRVVTGSAWHLGLRPAFYATRDELAVGFTAQLTGRWL